MEHCDAPPDQNRAVPCRAQIGFAAACLAQRKRCIVRPRSRGQQRVQGRRIIEHKERSSCAPRCSLTEKASASRFRTSRASTVGRGPAQVAHLPPHHSRKNIPASASPTWSVTAQRESSRTSSFCASFALAKWTASKSRWRIASSVRRAPRHSSRRASQRWNSSRTRATKRSWAWCCRR